MMGTQLSFLNPRSAIQEYLFSRYFGFLGILTLIGSSYGYNIEICQKTLVKGVEFSFSLKFTKPQQWNV
jgi:hypothetical protein